MLCSMHPLTLVQRGESRTFETMAENQLQQQLSAASRPSFRMFDSAPVALDWPFITPAVPYFYYSFTA